jgi:hypothetical protein
MKIKFVVTFVVALIVIVSSLNIYHINQIKKNRQKLVDESLILINHNKYLERCMRYRLNIDENKIPFVLNKDIIVYFSGKVCQSCVEKLLHFVSNKSKIKDRVLVLVDDPSKLNMILTYNDAYQLNFDYLFDSTKVLNPVNNILIFKMKKKEVKCVLEYSPEEKIIFEKYFSLLQ